MSDAIVIDLSHHNTVSTLQAAKADGIIGVIHKATEGQTVKDRKVDAREFLARQAGMLFGLYHFIRPGSIDKQCDNFLEVYNRYDNKNILIALDYEDNGVSLAMCETWCLQIEARAKKKPIIYSGHVLKEKLAGATHRALNGANYPLWLAQYGPKAELPAGWDDYLLWQYTDRGTVPGIEGAVDLNRGVVSEVTKVWTGSVTPEVTIPVGMKDFGDAMRLMCDGAHVRRKAWMPGIKIMWQAATGALTNPFIMATGVENITTPWVPSQLDMTATDWEEVE